MGLVLRPGVRRVTARTGSSRSVVREFPERVPATAGGAGAGSHSGVMGSQESFLPLDYAERAPAEPSREPPRHDVRRGLCALRWVWTDIRLARIAGPTSNCRRSYPTVAKPIPRG